MTQPLKKATTLREVHYLFDPVRDLSTEEELANLYVDRDNSSTREQIRLFLDSDLMAQRPVHLLFTGHRGSGKSTEINKLCSDLDGDFFIVKVSFSNRPDVDYVDVLLKAAMTLFKTATDEEVIKKSPAQIMEGLWVELNQFIENKLFKGMTISKDLAATASVSAKVNLWAVEFEGKFETEPQSRDTFKANSEKLLSEIVDKINLLSERIRTSYQRPVLFIFEDADKIDLQSAKDIFYQHSATLVNLRASAIYVIDIALRYNANFTVTCASFSEYLCLPNIKLVEKGGQPLPANRALLAKIIDHRADTALFAPDAKDLLITYSGGLIRSLISLIQRAASRAIIEKSPTINTQHVDHAIKRQKGDFIAMLASKDYPLLFSRHQDKQLTSDDDTQTLL
ncbi:MAG: AAA family ATPase [Methylovulum sp.]|nr:AAA family ATPase [Methylovulum sp.]